MMTNAKDISNLFEKQFEIGSWIVQNRSNEDEYGLVVGIFKNGSARAIVSSGTAAKLASTKGWYPVPRQIEEKDVPKKIRDKIFKKLETIG
jgi:hypothetical protein